MASDDVRAGRSAQPGPELVVAKGSGEVTPQQQVHDKRVKLFVTNVYNSSSSEEVSVEATDTVADLKKLLQETFANRPAPHQQRLIFRGKQCEERQQLGHVLGGVDLAERHTLHLVVTQPPDQQASASTTAASAQRPSRCPYPRRPVGTPGAATRSRSAGNLSNIVRMATTPSLLGLGRNPERIELTPAQMVQLQWQYQQALREQQQQPLQQQQQYRNQYLAWQTMALGQQRGGHAPASGAAIPGRPQWYPNVGSEVATAAATRALGGDMPGPAAGAAVRDITDGAPGMIQAAGLGEQEDGENGGGVRGNLVDPPPPAAGPPAVNRGRLLLQLCGIVAVFGLDAEEWQLLLLGIGAAIMFMYKTGFLPALLGQGREGGGLWKVLCTQASVIEEDEGFLLDLRFFFTSFVFSLFPTWKPRRSDVALLAEAAGRAAEGAAAARRARQAAQELVDEAAALAASNAAPVAPQQAQDANAEEAPAADAGLD